MGKIVRHQDLEVYKKAFVAAMRIYGLSKSFPKEETYSLIDQMRRSSRSVCANIAEAWRKRRYEAAFIAKLSDAEGEAAETQTWLEFSVKCDYLDRQIGRELFKEYDEIIAMIVAMICNPTKWVLPSGRRGERENGRKGEGEKGRTGDFSSFETADIFPKFKCGKLSPLLPHS